MIDLHCDLLFYLEGSPQRTAQDAVARCAIPQLRQGGVKLQTLAVFTQTGPNSIQKGLHQIALYQKLPFLYPQDVVHYSQWNLQSSLIGLLFAIENASGFCTEEEALSEGFNRFDHLIHMVGKPLYVSFTWNSENRFGGGALTDIGLKEDGKQLLNFLHQKKIAVDLSHASDRLAYEMIDYIDQSCLEIPLIASHSNARAITSLPRNLPDEITLEIFRRKGIVGLNLCRRFIGPTEESLLEHFAHFLALGGEEHLVVAADFFYEPDLPSSLSHGHSVFFPNYEDASCYGRLVDFLQRGLTLSHSTVEKIASQNALRFIDWIYS